MEFVRLKREDAMGQSEKRCWMEFDVEGVMPQSVAYSLLISALSSDAAVQINRR